MPDQENELAQLKEENQRLRATIRQLRKQLEAYQLQARRRSVHDYDHLEYDDDDRR
jgi:cell division protein FtsB